MGEGTLIPWRKKDLSHYHHSLLSLTGVGKRLQWHVEMGISRPHWPVNRGPAGWKASPVVGEVFLCVGAAIGVERT